MAISGITLQLQYAAADEITREDSGQGQKFGQSLPGGEPTDQGGCLDAGFSTFTPEPGDGRSEGFESSGGSCVQ